MLAAGRKAPGRRALDLLIAATALANALPLYTQNPDDFKPLADILDVVTILPREERALRMPAPGKQSEAGESERS